jgi:hypothetical protein
MGNNLLSTFFLIILLTDLADFFLKGSSNPLAITTVNPIPFIRTQLLASL